MDTAGEHDNLRAHELCAGVQAGEMVIFDKASVGFTHLADLSRREVFWVTRAKRIRSNCAAWSRWSRWIANGGRWFS